MSIIKINDGKKEIVCYECKKEIKKGGDYIFKLISNTSDYRWGCYLHVDCNIRREELAEQRLNLWKKKVREELDLKYRLRGYSE